MLGKKYKWKWKETQNEIVRQHFLHPRLAWEDKKLVAETEVEMAAEVEVVLKANKVVMRIRRSCGVHGEG